MTKAAIVGGVLAAMTLALIVYGMLKSFNEECEVCVTFEGRSACRTAAGRDRDEAVRTATDNACGLLTSGMTNSIRCGNTPPDRVTCRGD